MKVYTKDSMITAFKTGLLFGNAVEEDALASKCNEHLIEKFVEAFINGLETVESESRVLTEKELLEILG